MKNNYLYRIVATIGIWGNSKQEAIYPIYFIDADGQKLNGASRYTLRFASGQLPPVNAFWSLTMYELPASLLVANPLNRYLVNSPMLPQFKRDADGGLTLLIQNESPGKDKETNWLPAPKAPSPCICVSTGRRKKRRTGNGKLRRLRGRNRNTSRDNPSLGRAVATLQTFRASHRRSGLPAARNLFIVWGAAGAPMVRALLFDLFETLITESGEPPAGVSSLAPAFGCERNAFRAQWKARRPAVTVGRLSFRQALEEIALSLGQHADEATLHRICDGRVRAKARPFAQIDRDVVTMIDHLRSQGLRLAVISNCFAEDVVSWPQCAIASRFDCTLFSFEVGLAKPDPAIYLEATQRLGVSASDTWFIGDGQDKELSGATQAGLRAFRALWFLKRWPHYREAPSSVPDLSNIEEILTLVEHSHESVDSASTPAAHQ